MFFPSFHTDTSLKLKEEKERLPKFLQGIILSGTRPVYERINNNRKQINVEEKLSFFSIRLLAKVCYNVKLKTQKLEAIAFLCDCIMMILFSSYL